MSQPAIDIQAVSKQYEDVLAVNSVSFSVAPGSICALLGGNGAGKTTLLSMLLGLLLPTSGSLQISFDNGFHYLGLRFDRMNFSSPYVDLPQRLTVRENLTVYARLYGLSKANHRLDRLAAQLDIEGFLGRPYGTLSAGQRTRVALTKSLLNRPEVLLLDEPTASLDPDTAETIRGFLREYQQSSGATLLMASHNMLEVERLCDDVIILRQGQLVDRASPAELLQRYGRGTLEEVFIAVARNAGRGAL